ncbi:MAG: tetratricopeptide repeat protein [Gammaproteobacteria bacterium]|nr:MAG: tetratricopeptide repeat protein [Gammaproteobacteria bacterium]
MKILIKRISVGIVLTLIFLSGCSNTPSESRKSSTLSTNVELSVDEQSTYQEALEAIRSDNAEKAIQPLVKITRSHSEHIGAWINLANAYLKISKISEAESASAHAKEINPKVAEVYNLQGLIAVQKGEYSNAEKNYVQALQLKENYPSAHYNLGLLYDMYYQDLDRAIIHYDRYLELSDGADKKTIGWVAELKQKIKRRNK